jgi:hypothetical protein
MSRFRHMVMQKQDRKGVGNRMYNREEAVAYAHRHWNSPNPQFRTFEEDDCTNFVSQCLFAGGFPMEPSASRSRGWWYRWGATRSQDLWSYSWTVAHSLYLYLRGKARQGVQVIQMESADQLELGDVICYDWEGDGRWNHNTIVTWTSEYGPYVNARSVNSQYRFWEYTDSPAWTPQTRYAFFHIVI